MRRQFSTHIILLVTALFLGFPLAAQALISEPDVVFTGALKSGASGSVVSLTLNGAATPIKSFTVGADLNYTIRVPMDAYGARLAGTARTGDSSVIAVDGVMAAKYVIPARGTVVRLDLVKRSTDQWATDHPGDSGAGDRNRDGISDLQAYLSGLDPAACVWADKDATHAETTVYHPEVLKNCLAEAARDLKHNLIRIAQGTHAGNFGYLPANGEAFDLTLIGGFDPAGKVERSADPALTVLSGDTDSDGVGNGTVLNIDTDTGKTTGKVRLEGLTFRNGKAPAGQKGGGIRARIHKGDLELVGNMIAANSADSGGGVNLESSDQGAVFLVNNVIYGNNADNAAAARIAAVSGPVTLLNNTIAANLATVNGDGRSVVLETTAAAVDITNNIITAAPASTGADLFVNSSGNTIPLVVLNNAFPAADSLFANSTFAINASNKTGVDPLFMAPQEGNFRLAAGSPLIDKGFTHPKLTEKDASGVDRLVGGVVDLGAYEFKVIGTATVTLASLTQRYDGTVRSATATTTPAGLKVDITYNGSSVPPVAIGSYAVAATINDVNYTGSATGTLIVDKGVQTITFNPLAVQQLGGGDFAPGATASSALMVSYRSSNSAVATIVDGKIHLTGVGRAIITASQAGNADYGAAIDVSQTLTVVKSGPGPIVNVSTLSDNAVTTSPLVNVSGTISAPSGIKLASLNGNQLAVAADGSFSSSLLLSRGANTLTILVTDNDGLSTTVTRTVSLNTAAPAIALRTPVDNNVVSASTVEVAGTVGGTAASVTYTVNGGTPQNIAITSGSFAATAPLLPGLNTIEITATDNDSRKSMLKRTVTYNPAFSLAITSPAMDVKIGSSNYLLKGNVTDNTTPVTVTVTVDGKTFTPPLNNGEFTQSMTLDAEKTYAVVITAADQSNNSVSVQRNITRVWFGDASGTSGGSGNLSVADALASYKAVFNGQSLAPSVHLRLDVAPLGVDDKPSGDGALDLADVIMILRRAIGAGQW